MVRSAALLLFVLLMFSCRKETFTSDPAARLTTNVDSVHFDTVFTTTGSASQVFKIFNNNDEGIRITALRLAGGIASPFKINANGVPGPQVTDLAIPANDSAYVFVTVTINPTVAAQPFVVRDSIEINYNGHTTKVQLQAYGQNAHFMNRRIITGNETWNNDLPYVILGGLLVSQNAQLTINKGCKIFVHADAPLLIDGTLKVQGEKWDSTRVVFTGDRLDAPYRDYPASWPGIIFTKNSRNNSILYGTIKNAYQALVLQEPTVAASPVLQLSETIIDNAYDAGILAVNTGITAQNVLISNCGKNIALVKGGRYSFTHCTVASYSNSYLQHKEPVLGISNFISDNNTIATAPLDALFRNCIFWGESGGMVKDEVVVVKNGTGAFNVTFDGVLWPLNAAPANSTVTKALNGNPEFEEISTGKRFYNFSLKENSPAINAGTNTGVTLDITGSRRPVGLPDLGAYEKQ